jgi:hypothetical protein
LKDLLQRIALLGVIGILAAFVGITFVLFVIVAVVSAIANLSIWPMMFMAIFGFQWSIWTVFGIGALIALAIFLFGYFVPSRTERFFEVLGIVFSIAATAAMFFMITVSLVCAAGIPGYLLITFFSKDEPSPLWLPLIGVATLIPYYAWKRQSKTET